MGQDHRYLWALIVTGSLLLSGCAAVSKGRADLDLGMKERGIASWYGDDFHGYETASGELFNMHAFTAAHRTLPLGTVARIVNVVNGTHVMIRINDRGPYVNGRVLDLSYAAAKALGIEQSGVSAIQLEVVGTNLFEAGRTSSLVPMAEARELFEGALGSVSRQSPYVNSNNYTHHALARMMSTDILRERRTRRVGDVMAAERRVDIVAESAFL
jgi:peptidoglycan lytic transglycosylase